MTNLSRRLCVAVALGACVALGSSSVAAQAIGYNASVNGVRGTYPGERFDSVYVFNGVDVAAGRFGVTAAVPWVRVKTTPASLVDGGTTELVPSSTASGFGDPLVRLDLRLLDDRARSLQVGIATSVKLPMVDASSGRGTGKADYAVGSNVFKAIHRTSLIADLLFWKYGDPEGLDFKDAWSYSVGAGQLLGDGRWSALASVSGFSAGIGGMPPPAALNVSLVRLLARDQSLGVTMGFGLTDGSSDFSLGMSWRIARQIRQRAFAEK